MRIKSKIIVSLLGLVGALFAGDVQAAPDSVSFAGRLRAASGPVNGNVSVTFTIFDAVTGGSSQWTDTLPLTADKGLVFATLGRTGNPLDQVVLTGAERFLEITVQGETLTPRLPMNSTPYAVRSSGADSADLLGTLASSDVVTGVIAGTGLTGGGSGGDATLSIDPSKTQVRVGGSCTAGSSIASISDTGTVTCENDDNTIYAGGAGINITGTTVALTSCAAGQILKSTGAGYSCQVDVDTNTTYAAAANSGITLNGTAFGLTTCPNGQMLKAGVTAGTWVCSVDANTTYSAFTGGGITINAANQVSTDTTIQRRTATTNNMACPAGQYMRTVDQTFAWSCFCSLHARARPRSSKHRAPARSTPSTATARPRRHRVTRSAFVPIREPARSCA